MNSYKLNGPESALHKIIRDSKYAAELEVQEIAVEIATINHVLGLLNTENIEDIQAELATYKAKLLNHIENL